MEEKKITLFTNKTECCACEACVNSCPKGAITMKPDEYGFLYPDIDYTSCISCGSCVRVCSYKQPEFKNGKKEIYAAAVKDKNILSKSASGGIFAGMARAALDQGGVVFGAALVYENGRLNPKHIGINNETELYKLQGSKYVQSSIGSTYKEAKQFLDEGRKVIFSGTPCQISGLNSFLKKQYDNLLTIDIICHGVPSAQFFCDYIEWYENKNNCAVTDFSFRDKSKGQGCTHAIKLERKGRVSKKIFNGKVKSYTSMFLKSLTYRENCYKCPFAGRSRAADITIGDFWGFHSEYPNTDADLSNGKGVSCVIVNTQKGKTAVNAVKDNFVMLVSDMEKVARHNDQLNRPSILHEEKRKAILDIYKNEGYSGVEEYYKKNYKKDRIKEYIISAVPKGIKRNLQKLI
ncbi:MAG: Coenzyme F420 hydrogenase/dehydrogenase, beta subunit C-terminal domain [Candidatus Ornithomonoglobus sp.]